MSEANNPWGSNDPNAQESSSQPQYGQQGSPDQNHGNQPYYGQQQSQGSNPQQDPYANSGNAEYGQNASPNSGSATGNAYHQNGQAWNPQGTQGQQGYEYQSNQPNSQYQTGPQYPPQPNAQFPNQPPYYGQPNYVMQNPNQPWNVMSIIGFVLAFILPPVGLVLSIVAIVQMHRSRERGQGLAVGGAVVGGILSLLAALVIGLVIWGIAMVGSESYSYEYPSCSGYSCSSEDSGDDSLLSSYPNHSMDTLGATPASVESQSH
ncbi:MAG: DUF4190 domain-containing protein [Bifidobacterium sp.]|uniref:DUF4190 domain-containing protein n=1 Tax=Bifidobacterium sp. TaxID=41200 RepID=UPI0039ECA780